MEQPLKLRASLNDPFEEQESTGTYSSLKRGVCRTLHNSLYMVVHQGLRSLINDYNDNLL